MGDRWHHAALCLSLMVRTAIGCECAPPPPPCEAYASTELIFLGTVTEALEKHGDRVIMARMRVDKAYKGISKKSVILIDDGMCDGPVLQLGEQYLMYTRDTHSDYLPSRGCTRSRSVQDAKEDLAFLDAMPTAPPTATVFGQVTLANGKDEPAPGATVQILSGGVKRTTTTDTQGRYLFSGLPPATYAVNATRPGFHTSEEESDDPRRVAARGCAVINLVLRENLSGSITGRVTRAHGAPPPAGITLHLIQIDPVNRDRPGEVLLRSPAQTDRNGAYSFRNVAPGLYKVALNLYRPPTPEYPYPPTYWPDATTEAAGRVVEIAANGAPRECDFRLPTPLKPTPLKIVVLLPDGKPARNVPVGIDTKMNGISLSPRGGRTNASGEFSFSAMEGVEYSILDIFTYPGKLSAPVYFSAADRGQPIIIRLIPREPPPAPLTPTPR